MSLEKCWHEKIFLQYLWKKTKVWATFGHLFLVKFFLPRRHEDTICKVDLKFTKSKINHISHKFLYHFTILPFGQIFVFVAIPTPFLQLYSCFKKFSKIFICSKIVHFLLCADMSYKLKIPSKKKILIAIFMGSFCFPRKYIRITRSRNF